MQYRTRFAYPEENSRACMATKGEFEIKALALAVKCCITDTLLLL